MLPPLGAGRISRLYVIRMYLRANYSSTTKRIVNNLIIVYKRIGSAVSDPLPIVSGVPQGSILGPLLFMLYVNDLANIPKNSLSDCYVDDTKLCMSFRILDLNDTVVALNQDLLSVRNWCFDNRLLLNPDKTKLIIYGSRRMTDKLSEFHLSLLGKDLISVPTVKDLGVTFDKNLTFNDHIAKTVSSCMSTLGLINRVKMFLKRNVWL